MHHLPALHGGAMLVGEAWTVWTHAGVTYHRHAEIDEVHAYALGRSLAYVLVDSGPALRFQPRFQPRWQPLGAVERPA